MTKVSSPIPDTDVLRWLGLPLTVLRELAMDLPAHYHERLITDRRKSRMLLIPDRPLKRVQRRITRRLLSRFDVHPGAYCHRMLGPIAAARAHVRHPNLLQLDFADFFPNTSISLVHRTLRGQGLSDGMSRLVSEIVCFQGQLPQGAPSSVAISNLVMRPVDERIGNLCRRHGLTYTRYVDDVAISGGTRVGWVEKVVRKIIVDEGWQLNSKGGLFGPDQRRRYLGIILNSHPNIEAGYLRDLSSLMRRLGRAGAPITPKLRKRLQGRVNYVCGVHERKGARLQASFDRWILPLEDIKEETAPAKRGRRRESRAIGGPRSSASTALIG